MMSLSINGTPVHPENHLWKLPRDVIMEIIHILVKMEQKYFQDNMENFQFGDPCTMTIAGQTDLQDRAAVVALLLKQNMLPPLRSTEQMQSMTMHERAVKRKVKERF